jgi:predicted choloylglycine hydrolase
VPVYPPGCMDADLTFTALAEDRPGATFQQRWRTLAPALTAWYLRDGDAARPTYAQARQALRTHMPELVPTWEAMTDLAGGGDLAARILALYDPPPLLAGCSQAVIGGSLIRNYDYHPDRIEATVLRSDYTRPTLGMSDCLWGLLDGINDAGLAVALAFGGRQSRGDGFGITLIVRYLLETCDTVEQAVATLQRVPVHAPYNLTLAGPAGAATVYVGPDRAPTASEPFATNHQEQVDWPEHATATRSMERYHALNHATEDAFLEPPLYATEFARGFGTLYTAVYRPEQRSVTYRWPDTAWHQSLHAFTPGTLTVRLRERADRHVGAGPR